VRWLGGLLAARGMPQYLLERHLEHLHVELVRAAPERTTRYGVLQLCAADLRAMRVGRIQQAVFEDLAARFEERVERCSVRVKNMGVVLVAAVADERAGLPNIVASMESWTCDPERFDSEWIAAVRETLSTARAASR
jgi:hypothetical protein